MGRKECQSGTQGAKCQLQPEFLRVLEGNWQPRGQGVVVLQYYVRGCIIAGGQIYLVKMLKARWLRVDDRIIAIEDQTNQNNLQMPLETAPPEFSI